jgi:hypothetical protein
MVVALARHELFRDDPKVPMTIGAESLSFVAPFENSED